MKENKFLKWYAIIIFILLIAIMFIIPDNFYLKLDTIINKPKITTKPQTEIKFSDIKTQKNNLLNKNYEYEYLMMDSMGKKTIIYECTGKIENKKEIGNCTSPTKVSYTEKDKNQVFKDINTNYINLEKIFELIKDIEPKEFTYNKAREMIYNTKILDLETEITLYTDLNNINQINISNAYMTYVFKYNHSKD